jgi:hypothetical protein
MRTQQGLWLALSLTLAGPVAAGELENFVAAQNGALSCWSRNYDRAHMAAHSDQTVTDMRLGIRYQTPLAGDTNSPYAFALAVNARTVKGVTRGECTNEGGKIACRVECDGGGVVVSAAKNGNVLLDLTRSGFIQLSEACSESDTTLLEAGKDDKSFLLNTAQPSACEGLFRE